MSVSAQLKAQAWSDASRLPLVCLELDHDDLATPIRVVNNNEDVVVDGVTYTAFAFDVTLPENLEDAPPRARLRIDNVSREIAQAVRSITTPASVSIRVVRVQEVELVGVAKATTPTSETSSGGTDLVIPVPTGVEDGDHLFAITFDTSGALDISEPAGWTLLKASGDTTNVWTRTAASEPASYTWTVPNGVTRAGAMVAVRGGAVGTPEAATAPTPTITAPTVTAGPRAGGLWLGFATFSVTANAEDVVVTAGEHVIQVQHAHDGTGHVLQLPGKVAASVISGLTSSQEVSGQKFQDPNAATANHAVAATVVDAQAEGVLELEFPSMILRNVVVTALTVEGQLELEQLVREPFPAMVFSPAEFPGLLS